MSVGDAFAAELTAFEQHKKDLLDILRNVHWGNPKTTPFDEATTWRALIRVALAYFQRIKQETMLPERQIERMKDLAKALRHAGKLAQKAIQDEVGDHLLRGWCIESKVTPPPLSLDRMVDQVTKAVVGLGKLESAAIAGSRGLRPKSGRQRGTGVLSFHETLALWRVYRSSTGQDPRLEAGPFADFAQTFLVAVGKQKETENDYVVEHFKYLRKQHRKEALRRALSRASTDRTQLGE